jgi:DNA-binding transcriptional MerR regulator
MNATVSNTDSETALKAKKAKPRDAAANGNGNGAEAGEMTIDELAQRSGMTVRNIRAHQSRGLLPAPNVRGRIGYYDDRHTTRLELIRQLQTGGFNLTAIQRLVERAEQTGDNIGDLRNLVLTSFAVEQSEVVTRAELDMHLGSEINARLLKKSIEVGFVLPLDDDRFEVLSPTILRAAVQCVELGVSLDSLIDVLKTVNSHSRAIADAFTKMVDEGIIRPVEREGMPPEAFPRVLKAIGDLRPLAAEVALAGFRLNMDSAAEDAFGKILQRIAKEDLRLPESDDKSGGAKQRERGRVSGAAKNAVKSAAKSGSKTKRETAGAESGAAARKRGRRQRA